MRTLYQRALDGGPTRDDLRGALEARLPGSFVYALAEGGGVGSLCQVTSDDGEELVVEYWRLDLTKAARKVGAGPVFLRERAPDRETYEADRL